jgi:hypothetical protein
MDLMQPVPPTAQPVLVSALAAALIFMPLIHPVQLIQVSAPEAVVREVSAQPLLIPNALLTVVTLVVIMVTAAAGSAVLRKPVVILIAIARTACVIVVPILIALIHATPTIVIMVSVRILINPTVKRIAANWPSPKGRSLVF